MYHGLSAYNKLKINDNTLLELLQRVKTLKSVDSCWSDESIGPVGVFVDPENATIYRGCHHDCYSGINQFGERDANTNDLKWNHGNNWDFYKKILNKVDKTKKYGQSTAEFFVSNVEPDAVWFNKKYGKKWELRARLLANKLGLPLLERN